MQYAHGGRGTPGSQAGQRPAHARRDTEDHRLRAGEAARRHPHRRRPEPCSAPRRTWPGAGDGGRPGRSGGRRVRPGGHPRPADRPPPFAGRACSTPWDGPHPRAGPAGTILTARLPRDLETVCLKCLQKEPARRTDAGELADDLALPGRPGSWPAQSRAGTHLAVGEAEPVVGRPGSATAVLILAVASSRR